MTAPTEDEVRAWLAGYVADDIALPHSARCAASALAKFDELDEARKDRQLIDNLLTACRALDVGQRSGDAHQAQLALLNWRKALAAIDQARGA